MALNRRLFLGGALLAPLAAPAIVRAESLMRLWLPKREILVASFHPDLIELLNETNKILADMPWVPARQVVFGSPTRVALPTPTWRRVSARGV